jgi:hypothetical protein
MFFKHSRLLNSGIDILGQEINTIAWFHGLILGTAADEYQGMVNIESEIIG